MGASAARTSAVRRVVPVLAGAVFVSCGDAPPEESVWPSPRPAGAPEYMRIEPGTFTMGSEVVFDFGRDDSVVPEHEVTLTRPFCVQATEVTRGQWRRLMGTEPSWWATCVDEFEEGESCGVQGTSPSVLDGWWIECEEGCPVEFVSWWDAIAYCNALSEIEGRETCYDLSSCDGTPGNGDFECSWFIEVSLDCTGYRLPTEAEWEYAARAGAGTEHGYPCGDPVLDAFGCPSDFAWMSRNSDLRPHLVGTRRPNEWGLYDMLGNVLEFTGDGGRRYTEEPVVDPNLPMTTSRPVRVVRGGSLANSPLEMWAFAARGAYPYTRDALQGFRVVRTVAPDAPADPDCPSGAEGPP